MPANTAPIFTLTANVGHTRLATANTNRDGTGTVAIAFTAGAFGSRVGRIVIMATGTTTAGMVRLFVHDGTNFRLWHETTVTAITPSATVLGFRAVISTPDAEPLLVLPTSYTLRASTHNAESIDVIVHGADF